MGRPAQPQTGVTPVEAVPGPEERVALGMGHVYRSLAIAGALRKSGVPVVAAVNKVDLIDRAVPQLSDVTPAEQGFEGGRVGDERPGRVDLRRGDERVDVDVHPVVVEESVAEVGRECCGGHLELLDHVERGSHDRVEVVRVAQHRLFGVDATGVKVLVSGVQIFAPEIQAGVVVGSGPLGLVTRLALVAANMVPLVGVLFLGWDLSSVMVLFWAESAVIAFYTALKMAFVVPASPSLTAACAPSMRARWEAA